MSLQCLPGFSSKDPCCTTGNMPDFPFPQISPNVGTDGTLLLCLFYKPLKPTALSAVEAYLVLAQSCKRSESSVDLRSGDQVGSLGVSPLTSQQPTATRFWTGQTPLAGVGERIFTQGTLAPACGVDPRPSRAPALRGPGRAGGGGRTTAAVQLGGGGRRPPLRLAAPPPPARAACPQPRAQPAPALSPGAGSCRRGDAQGRDASIRFAPDPGRARIKPSAGCGNPGSGSLRSAERRGRSLRLPAPPPLGPGCRSGVPSARAQTARAPRLYLQPSNEESPGESTGAGGDVSCAWGCCCRRGCLKLPKLRASERLPPAGS